MVVQSETDVFGTLALPPGPPTRQRALPAVGGRGRRALRHVLLVRVGARLRLAAGRRARRAHCARRLVGHADRGSDQLRAADALRAPARVRRARPMGARRHARRRRPHGSRPTPTANSCATSSASARGGVRTPWVDAPLAVLSGLGQPGDMTELFGTTRPLDDGTRSALPAGRDEYVDRFRARRRRPSGRFPPRADAPRSTRSAPRLDLGR